MEKSYAEKEYLVLKTIYDACRANNYNGIPPFSLYEAVGLDERETDRIVHGIDQKGWLSNQSTGTYVLNSKGVEVADRMKTENKTINHYKVLNEIYNLSKANTAMPVGIDQIEKNTGISSHEMNGILSYLEERGLIEFPSGDIVRIKGRGIDEIEQTKNHPDQRTNNFPTNIVYNTHIHGDNYGGMQNGGENNTQNNQININPEFDNAIKSIIDLVKTSSLSNFKKEDLISDIQRIQNLAKQEPSLELVEHAKSKISYLETAFKATDLAIKAGHYFPHIYAFFEGLIK